MPGRQSLPTREMTIARFRQGTLDASLMVKVIIAGLPGLSVFCRDVVVVKTRLIGMANRETKGQR